MSDALGKRMIDYKMHSVRERFRKGLPLEEGSVRPEILASWQRSKNYGLSYAKPNEEILSAEQLQVQLEKSKTLLDIAIPFIESLYEFTKGLGILSTLTDQEGYVLYTLGDPEVMDLSTKNALIPGSNSSERCRGTNAIGTVIYTGRPMQIIGEEHYHTLYQNWVCSGAPIYLSSGEISGVFCLIGTPDKVSYHTLGMSVASAEAITRQIEMRDAYAEIEKIKEQQEIIVESVPSGVILLNHNKNITMLNSNAAKLLTRPRNSLIGKSIGDIFDEDFISHYDGEGEIEELSVNSTCNGRKTRYSVNMRSTSADNYVLTFDTAEVLHKKINRIIGSEAHFTFHDIIGDSEAIHNTVTLAKIAADNDSNVLLMGESGTGKELFAQAIHNASDRNAGPFVAINCGALPRSLIESELFGYESGTFTGAHKNGSAGKFELADGGTIFLDEIGEMPLDAQATLLRVLQNRLVTRLGGHKTISIDVRVIAATNKSLITAVESNAFRSDLYYRLNTFTILIPPLRERISDIQKLSNFFLQKYANNSKHVIEGITKDALNLLELHVWKGNVRELENVIERAVYLSQGGLIGVEELYRQPDFNSQKVEVQLPYKALSNLQAERRQMWEKMGGEKEIILRTLQDTQGNIRKAAQILGISRRTLYRKLEKHDISYGNIRMGLPLDDPEDMQ